MDGCVGNVSFYRITAASVASHPMYFGHRAVERGVRKTAASRPDLGQHRPSRCLVYGWSLVQPPCSLTLMSAPVPLIAAPHCSY